MGSAFSISPLGFGLRYSMVCQGRIGNEKIRDLMEGGELTLPHLTLSWVRSGLHSLSSSGLVCET